MTVIGAVHGQGNRIVVHSRIRYMVRPGNPGTCTAATGEQVYYQLFFSNGSPMLGLQWMTWDNFC